MRITPPPSSAAPRPYTSYHLFFQLEREYILQRLLGHRPAIDPTDAFDPDDRANYRGPPLPPRYAGLALPRDWHIPGKGRRRRRVHRRSHGKIGFHELNGRISDAWSSADGDVRRFCVRLSRMETGGYGGLGRTEDEKKTASIKKTSPKTAPKIPPKEAKSRGQDSFQKKTPPDSVKSEPREYFDDPASLIGSDDDSLCEEDFARPDANMPASDIRHNDSLCPEDFARPEENVPSYEMCHMISLESANFEVEFPQSQPASHWDSLTANFEIEVPQSQPASHWDSLTEVDMEDGEIIDMWRAAPASAAQEGPPAVPSSCQMRGEIPKADRVAMEPEWCRTCVEMPGRVGFAIKQEDEDAKMSYIDAEYERYREIGKRFSSARRGTPDDSERKTFGSRQA